MKGKVARILAVAGSVVLASAGAHIYVSANASRDKICEGIYIGSIDVGGMSVEKATKKVKKYVEEAKNENVTVKIDDEKVTTTLEEFGYSCDVIYFVEEAYNYG